MSKPKIKPEWKLPTEFKTKWVKALRSGKYPQTTGQLVTGGSYCCLGVACAINGINRKKLVKHGTIPASFKSIPAQLRDEDADSVLTSPLGEILIDLNDHKHWSFPKIAAYIERYL